MRRSPVLGRTLDDLAVRIFFCKSSDRRERTSASVSVAAIFDNEEVGSGTKQGADSTF